jgi:NAD(P)-dependent dehydrogenase (short-subunit alcohol dehydrogenase family)
MEINKRPVDSEFRMPSLRVDGKVALVTGGSRGLGLGIAMALAHSGANLALVARDSNQLDQASKLVRSQGNKVFTFQTDLRESNSIEQVIKDVTDHYGRLDIVVNAAGTNVRKPAEQVTLNEWDEVMDLNLKAVFFACRAAAAVMKEQGGGKIINVGSMTFERAVPNVAIYAASKGGMRSLTMSLALEWAGANIQVNNIVPGRFWTAMTNKIFSDPEMYKKAIAVIPQGRPGFASDLAGTAVLLSSEASDYITGQTIVVDGGWMINSGLIG